LTPRPALQVIIPVAFNNGPTSGDTCLLGETIGARVTFSTRVNGKGNVGGGKLTIGTETRTALQTPDGDLSARVA